MLVRLVAIVALMVPQSANVNNYVGRWLLEAPVDEADRGRRLNVVLVEGLLRVGSGDGHDVSFDLSGRSAAWEGPGYKASSTAGFKDGVLVTERLVKYDGGLVRLVREQWSVKDGKLHVISTATANGQPTPPVERVYRKER